MVSEAYRELEDRIARVQSLHDDCVGELVYKLKQDKSTVERALYLASITTNGRPTDIAFVVNEFLVHLDEGTRAPEQGNTLKK